MTISRRSFLKGMLGGAGIIVGAPAICSAKNLMKIWVPSQEIIAPAGFGRFYSESIDDWIKQANGETLGRDYHNVWISENPLRTLR